VQYKTYLSRINGKAALAGTAILFVIDLYLFKSGLSWTPLHYESLAPMLVMASNQGWTQRYAAIASTLLFGSVVILYFAFGLSYQLVSESWTFIAIASAAILIYIFQLWKVIATNRHIPFFLFLITALSLLTADKLFSRDMLSSAYLPHFFKVGNEANSTISHNSVYGRLKNTVSSGHGGILVVFESLGVPKDRSILSDLIRAYPEFDITILSHEGGSTLPAEIRYLCGINGGFNDHSLCITKQIDSRAMHGNTLAYFNRAELYHSMGFKKIFGQHELSGLETCNYSYTAICDRSLRQRLLQEVNNTKCSKFHYVLTIDSHFPYSKYSNHVSGLYGDLSEWLETMKIIIKAYPGCQVVIVGDHPPPLSHHFEAKTILMVASPQ
jgi:hypothetical protein